MRKKYRDDIRDKVKEMISERAVDIVQCLYRNVRKGDTKAAKILLEIAGIYTPGAKTSVDVNVLGLAERMRRAEARVNANADYQLPRDTTSEQ